MNLNFHVPQRQKSQLTVASPSNKELWGYDEFKLKYTSFWEGVRGSRRIAQERGIDDHIKVDKTISNHKLLKKRDRLLIYPDSRYKLIWDIIISMFIVYTVLSTPFEVFIEQTVSREARTFQYILEGFFLTDILVTFNTAIIDSMHHDNLITDRELIVISYLKLWFWVDLISSLPLTEIVNAMSVTATSALNFQLLQLLRLFRLFRIFRIFKLKRLNVHIDSFNINPAVFNLIALVFQIVIVAHFVSCFWYFLSTPTITGDPYNNMNTYPVTWLSGIGLVDAPSSDQYIGAIYWTFATMLSVGYGDILAHTWPERLFAIICMLSGGVLFGAVISQMTRLIEMRNPQKRILKLKMAEFKSFLVEKAVPPKLRLEAQEAYAYTLPKKSPFTDPTNIMLELPDKLLMELTKNIFAYETANIDAFHTLNPDFIMKLIMYGRHYRVKRGDILYEFGDVSEDMTFVLEGMVRISTQLKDQDIVAGYVTTGDYCGELEYLSKCTRLATYKAASSCKLFSVSYKILHEAMIEHYEAGVQFKNELNTRLHSFRKVLKMSAKPPEDVEEPFKIRFLGFLRRHDVTAMDQNILSQRKRPPIITAVSPPPVLAASAGISRKNSAEITNPQFLKRKSSQLGGSSANGSKLENSSQNSKGSISRLHSLQRLSSTRMGWVSAVNLLAGGFHGLDPILVREQIWLNGNIVDPEQMTKDLNSLTQLLSHDEVCHVIMTQPVSELPPPSTISFQSSHSDNHQESLSFRTKVLNRPSRKSALSRYTTTSSPTKKKGSLSSQMNSGTSGMRSNRSGSQGSDIHDHNPPSSSFFNLMPQQNRTVVNKEIEIAKLNHYYLLHPKGSFKSKWDLFICCLIIWSVMYIPVVVGFDVITTDSWLIMGYVLDFMFFIDVILSFRTVYFSDVDDAYIGIPLLISRHYLATWFIVDISTCIPYDVFVYLFQNDANNTSLFLLSLLKVLRLARLLKLVRILKLPEYIQKVEESSGISPIIAELIMTILQVLMISHFVACFWWGICQSLSSEPWMSDTSKVPADATLAEKYLTSLYMVVTTLTTTGYGDLISVNSAERVVDIFMMILGATIFGYVIATVANIMSNLNVSQVSAREKLSEVSQFLHDRNCQPQLSKTILKHFRHTLSQKSIFDEKALLNDLPTRLSNQIYLHIQADTINKIPIFKYIDNKMVALHIFKQLVPMFTEAGQVIIKQHDMPSDVYFLISGRALVYTEDIVAEHTHNNNDNKDINQDMSSTHPHDTNVTQHLDHASPTHIHAHHRDDESTSDIMSHKSNSTQQEASGSNTFLAKLARNISKRMPRHSHVHTKATRQSAPTSHIKHIMEIVTGDYVGLTALLSHRRQKASVKSITSCHFYVLRNQELLTIIREQPAIALSLQIALGKAVAHQNKVLSHDYLCTTRRDFYKEIKEKYVEIKKKPPVSNVAHVIQKHIGAVRRLSRSISFNVMTSDHNSSQSQHHHHLLTTTDTSAAAAATTTAISATGIGFHKSFTDDMRLTTTPLQSIHESQIISYEDNLSDDNEKEDTGKRRSDDSTEDEEEEVKHEYTEPSNIKGRNISVQVDTLANASAISGDTKVRSHSDTLFAAISSSDSEQKENDTHKIYNAEAISIPSSSSKKPRSMSLTVSSIHEHQPSSKPLESMSPKQRIKFPLKTKIDDLLNSTSAASRDSDDDEDYFRMNHHHYQNSNRRNSSRKVKPLGHSSKRESLKKSIKKAIKRISIPKGVIPNTSIMSSSASFPNHSNENLRRKHLEVLNNQWRHRNYASAKRYSIDEQYTHRDGDDDDRDSNSDDSLATATATNNDHTKLDKNYQQKKRMYRLRKRQSFPSLDNVKWKSDIRHQVYM